MVCATAVEGKHVTALHNGVTWTVIPNYSVWFLKVNNYWHATQKNVIRWINVVLYTFYWECLSRKEKILERNKSECSLE